MKHKFFSILNLAVIMFYVIRPSLPYIEYVLNKEYIEKNLCVEKDNPENNCHGKCHLHEQLNKQSEPQDADTNGNKKISQEKKIDDHLKGFLSIPDLFGMELTWSDRYSASVPTSYISRIFVPPKY